MHFLVLPFLHFRFYIGSKFNVVVCDRKLIKQIMIDHGDNLHCGGTCTVMLSVVHVCIIYEQFMYRRTICMYCFNLYCSQHVKFCLYMNFIGMESNGTRSIKGPKWSTGGIRS